MSGSVASLLVLAWCKKKLLNIHTTRVALHKLSRNSQPRPRPFPLPPPASRLAATPLVHYVGRGSVNGRFSVAGGVSRPPAVKSPSPSCATGLLVFMRLFSHGPFVGSRLPSVVSRCKVGGRVRVMPGGY